ncbi:hypothetical protein RRG08_014467 [Elysia crispata]|uniref:Uncharacterized protein n=1 Tax=Elysia crispata TaxID=231223 RepID=A0AAE0Y6G1_9GAST|nr:hypothetical protein RRG08_014467 [Elysia crispata]
MGEALVYKLVTLHAGKLGNCSGNLRGSFGRGNCTLCVETLSVTDRIEPGHDKKQTGKSWDGTIHLNVTGTEVKHQKSPSLMGREIDQPQPTAEVLANRNTNTSDHKPLLSGHPKVMLMNTGPGCSKTASLFQSQSSKGVKSELESLQRASFRSLRGSAMFTPCLNPNYARLSRLCAPVT